MGLDHPARLRGQGQTDKLGSPEPTYLGRIVAGLRRSGPELGFEYREQIVAADSVFWGGCDLDCVDPASDGRNDPRLLQKLSGSGLRQAFTGLDMPAWEAPKPAIPAASPAHE